MSTKGVLYIFMTMISGERFLVPGRNIQTNTTRNEYITGQRQIQKRSKIHQGESEAENGRWKADSKYNGQKKVEETQIFKNTVVSNHFHSVKILLFSSARSRDFDGTPGTELPVSMYTTKTPIDMCRFNVRSSTLKNLSIFCKRQISIELFYSYQRLQCRDKYFFKIKIVFFLYLRLSASSKENDLPLCIFF